MIYTIDKLIEARPGSSIPESLQKKVDVILLNKKSLDWQIFGSSMYRIQKYYGDIDVREHFFSNKSIEDIINKTAKSLQRMVTEINSTKISYFSEIKAGLDTRYAIDIGFIENGIYYPTKDLPFIVKEYYKKKLFDKNEYTTIKNNLKGSLLANNYDIIYNIIRERRILRWTAKEVLIGKKILPLDITITLIEALKMKTHIKIDYITTINGNFIEVTNIMFLGHKTEDGELYLINTFSNYLESYVYVRQMRDDIEKLFFSEFYFNPFKACKRLYALFRSFYIHSLNFNNLKKEQMYENYIEKIVSLIKGDVSYLYQIKSFLGSIKRLYKLKIKIPEIALINQINMIQFNLTNILFLPLEQINNINEIISLFKKTKNNEIRLKIIDILSENFTNWINGKTIAYLNKVNMNPFPKQAYPLIHHYVHKKININYENKKFIALLFVKVDNKKSIILDNNNNQLLIINNIPDIYTKSRTDIILPENNFDDWINDNYEEDTINLSIINNIENKRINNNKSYFNRLKTIYENKIDNDPLNKIIKDDEEDYELLNKLLDDFKLPKKLNSKKKAIEQIKKDCEEKSYSKIYHELLGLE